ncbi:enoyl-CoA hydratase/isomerase family protein [Roseococcus pinisoli]|uniref:Enoyl-CoA hydratase/isomerase family protein n=1 Tax=Roseococcus pinisoli TaxID=2835040 RepID=A0ABS5QD31_9PROT|nr:enoyl-CoA hydratase/isomerase family protein [Roseococcus pinisoli]MBS7811594.1 enoyl-CoA hydratase/isomerase family protein [Roseococcus pinisoli]
MDGMQAEATTPLLTIDGARATIRLNRPAVHNRIEPPDLLKLLEHFETIEADPAIRVVILTGTGKSFSSGYHLGDMANRPDAEVTAADGGPSFESVGTALENLKVPVICRLNGGVYGGSTDFALCCDFRIGTEQAEMFMPAARIGLHYYPAGMKRYVSRLGLNAAKKLFLTAEKIFASEMLAIGYLTEVVSADQLDARVDALATRIASLAPLAVQGVKRSLNEIARQDFDEAGAIERARASQKSEDLREGLTAFREKRAPVFKGR